MSKAERVQRLEAYRFSSYPGYVAKKGAEDFVCYDVLKQYGATPHGARRFYRAYTHARVRRQFTSRLGRQFTSRFGIVRRRGFRHRRLPFPFLRLFQLLSPLAALLPCPSRRLRLAGISRTRWHRSRRGVLHRAHLSGRFHGDRRTFASPSA